MLQPLFFLLIGVGIGVATGVIPGFHPNLVAVLLLSLAPFTPMGSAIMLVAAGVTNTFLNFIPSIYLGAPSASTALSVLPGHKMLLEGRAYEALRLTVVGGLISIVFVVVTLPLTFNFVSHLYPVVKEYMHLILLAVIGYMFLKDRDLNGAGVFVLSGLLGYVVMEMNFIGTRYDLFPLLSGLFGVSMLLHSLRKEPEIPPQDRSVDYVGSGTALRGGLVGSLAGMVVGLLPGIGSAQATYMAQEISGRKGTRNFMVAIGGVNTSNIIFSLLALYLIGRGRSGIAVSISNLLTEITLNTSLIFVIVAIASAGSAAFLTLYIGKRGLGLFRMVDYRKLCAGVIVFILTMAVFLTGPRGLIVALVGSVLGLSSILSGARRSYLMGCILIPVILFYL